MRIRNVFFRISRHVRIYATLELLQLRMQLEYEADFWIGIVGAMLTQVAGFVFIWAVFERIPSIVGWNFWEVALLFALVTIPRGLRAVLCDGPWRLRHVVYGGDFDRVLLRPISPALQVITQFSTVHGFGTAALGLAVLVRAAAELGLVWDIPRVAFLVLTVVCSVVILSAIDFATNCVAFWEPGATSAFPFAAAQLPDFARYPLTIYGLGVQVLFTWIVPVAFCSYYPGALLLGKTVDPPWLPLLSPLAAAMTVAAASGVWRLGLVRYQSTGH